MKLPWDKNYLKISFHVIITILAVYILGLLIKNMSEAKDTFFTFFHWFVSILGPLLTALIFSYLADPVVDFFQKQWERVVPPKGNPGRRFKMRKSGTLITYLILICFILFGIKLMVSKIGSANIEALALSFSNYIQGFSDMFVLLKVKLAEIGVLENVDSILQGWVNTLTLLIKNTAFAITDSVTKAGSWALNLFLGLTVAFYFLMEKERILYYAKDVLYTFLPCSKAKKIEGVCHDFNVVFSGYIGGQITDAIIMAVLLSTAFTIAGIKYALVIGIISGFSNLIPYLGAVVAFILSVSVGLLSGTPLKALYAGIIVLVLQQIDGIFIVPKVVGKSVELHPALVLLSLSIFGGIFGIAGMIIAVPFTALIKLFLTRLYLSKKSDR